MTEVTGILPVSHHQFNVLIAVTIAAVLGESLEGDADSGPLTCSVHSTKILEA